MIVVDWGTTNLRAYLCRDDGTIVERLSDGRGIKAIGRDDYPVVLSAILERFGGPDRQVFISGMAGSRGGWTEVPYCQAAVSAKDLGGALKPLPSPFRGFLVPGVRTVSEDGTSDVMRGEEVQVFGAARRLDLGRALLGLPGTHSKWVRLEDGAIKSFTTFMTGDVFQALGQTILACKIDDPFASTAFSAGLEAAGRCANGVLHQLFTARTRMLDGALEEAHVSSFVSGLLIGHELRQVADLSASGERVVIIGSDNLAERYRLALHHFSVEAEVLGSDVATCAGIAALQRHVEDS